MKRSQVVEDLYNRLLDQIEAANLTHAENLIATGMTIATLLDACAKPNQRKQAAQAFLTTIDESFTALDADAAEGTTP